MDIDDSKSETTSQSLDSTNSRSETPTSMVTAAGSDQALVAKRWARGRWKSKKCKWQFKYSCYVKVKICFSVCLSVSVFTCLLRLLSKTMSCNALPQLINTPL